MSTAVADDGSSTADKPRGEGPVEVGDSNVDAKGSAERDVTSDATTKNAAGESLDNRW